MGNSVDHLFAGKEVPSRQVQTNYGPIVGRRIIYNGERQVDAFVGYPYAAPPIGMLRFKKPIAHEPWTDVKKLVKFGARSIQSPMIPLIDRLKLGPISEDCLFLNIFTPVWHPGANNPNGFPVMVFVHGGGFVMDSTVKYGDIGIAKYMVRHSVVVVTLQYRLGYLGFFSTGDAECPGNIGLWDQTFALQWINNNIGAFNGDRSRITLFGQSAGGVSVDLLSLSPHSRHLFQQVIPMAGNASCDWSLCHNVVESSRRLAFSLGCTSTDSGAMLDHLRTIAADRFATPLKLKMDLKDSVRLDVGPRIDGDFFPKSLDELYKEAPNKRRLIGTAHDEGLIFSIFSADPLDTNTMQKIIAYQIPESKYENFKELREQALEMYINDRLKLNYPDRLMHIKRAAVNLYGDMSMNKGTQKVVDMQIERDNQHVYLYSFDYVNPKSFGLIGFKMPFKGPTHCTELAYLFGVGIIASFKFNQDDEQMIDIMTRLFTNFAKYGNPNCLENDQQQNIFVWQPVSKEHPNRYLSINMQPEMRQQYQDGRPRFWLDIEKQQKDK